MEDSPLKPLNVDNEPFSIFFFRVLKEYGVVIAVVFVIVNSLVLDYLLASRSPKSSPLKLSAQNTLNLPFSANTSCSQACVDQINTIVSSKTSSITSSVTSALPAGGSPTPTPTPTPAPTPNPTVKEFFVPLGAGFGNAADWTVVPGIEAKIDPANYGKIKKVTFEITVRIPTGNQTVNVRLYNANTYQTVVNSDLTLAGGTPTLLVSQPITLLSGSNTYQIQLKTQLQYITYIDQARLRIQTE